jgi:hypothetical protein
MNPRIGARKLQIISGQSEINSESTAAYSNQQEVSDLPIMDVQLPQVGVPPHGSDGT